MNDAMLRDIQQRLARLERVMPQIRLGVVDDLGPLGVKLGGSDTAYENVKSIGTVGNGDQVAALVANNDLLVLGSIPGFEIRAFTVNGSTGGLFWDAIGNADVSVARTAVGRYTVTWTRPWPNNRYTVVGSCYAGGSGIGIWSLNSVISHKENGFGCQTLNNDVFSDASWMCVAIGPRE